MHVLRVFWRREPRLPAQVEYWAFSNGGYGFGATPAGAVKSARHAYRRNHGSAPCCGRGRCLG